MVFLCFIEPTYTFYSAGTYLDLSGLVVTATYSDESTEDVTSNCTFNPSIGEPLGTNDTCVTISYGGKTTTLEITVDGSGYGPN